MPFNLKFGKTGKEIKVAVQKRRQQLQDRLNKRNQALDEFLKDEGKVRSYIVRQAGAQPGFHQTRGYVLYSKDAISSEEIQEVSQLCQRIFEMEQELHRLDLLLVHLNDTEVFELTFEDLVGYGFDTALDSQ